MEDIIRVKAPVTELIILMIALITSVVYGSQRTQYSGTVAWYNSPLILFVAISTLSIGSFLAYTSALRPRVFVQYLSAAIILSLLYPAVTSGVTIARQKDSRDGGVYSTVQTVLLVISLIVIALNLFIVIGIGVGNVSPDLGARIITYTIPITISVLLFSSAILVST
jgi:hypothetical protein